MASIKENIAQAIADFDAIKAAIERFGVNVPHGTDTKDYATLLDVARSAYYTKAEITELLAGKADKEGTWELIDEVTIGANVREKTKSVDSDGNPLYLKGIKIYVNAPQVSGASDRDPIKLAIHANSEGIDDIARIAYSTALCAVKCQANYTATIKYGAWEDTCKMIVAGTPVLPTFSSTLPANFATEADKPFIRSWTISNTKGAGHYLPPGTTIKILGIQN